MKNRRVWEGGREQMSSNGKPGGVLQIMKKKEKLKGEMRVC